LESSVFDPEGKWQCSKVEQGYGAWEWGVFVSWCDPRRMDRNRM